MSWVTEIVEASTKVFEKSFEFDGKTRTGFFKRISAAERTELLSGQRPRVKGGETEMEIDLGTNEKGKQKMVFFSACDQDGKRVFAKASEVAELEAPLVETLYKLASEVNKNTAANDEGDSGKA